MNLLIAIPVYNEKDHLDGVIRQVKQYAHDILLIDDGSTDGTSELLDAREKQGDVRVIHHAKNAGYGQSLIDAFNYAGEHGYDWVITMDCDEQHEPEMIPEFIRHLSTECWDTLTAARAIRVPAAMMICRPAIAGASTRSSPARSITASVCI